MLSLFAILILSFFLGMRLATDPDHVVAVTTIVTKQRGIAKAGLIGVLWGLGHTFTIFLVGTMIILFQVTIPPRVGLSMEFTVAAMLILLGVLNLTGTLRWLQGNFTPSLRLLAPDTELSNSAANSKSTNPESRLQAMFKTLGLFNVLRPLMIGIVHGLAGSAAVALLVMTTIHNSWWAIASGLLSLGFGLFLSYQIGFVDGLFSSHPRWTPH